MRRGALIAGGAAAAAVGAVWFAFPSVGRPPPTGKSGAGPALDLSLVVVGREGTSPTAIATRFARSVSDLSHGSMNVTLRYIPSGAESTLSSRDAQAAALEALRTGDAQVGLIPTGAFRPYGVTTFQALHAPFLVTSASLADRVTTGAIAARLQAGLARLSLAGLALVPDGLERPFGFLKALVAPADFAGVTIRASYSPDAYALLRVLGARPVEVVGADSDTAVYSGFTRDAVSVPSAADTFPNDSFTASNVVLFPSVETIVVSNGALESLTPRQRAVLRRAAGDARARMIADTDERKAAAAFCRAGGTIVDASPAAVRALRAKTAPLLHSMTLDEPTREIVDAIRRLPSGSIGVHSCTRAASVAPVGLGEHYSRSARDRLVPPNGSYRRAFTASQLRAVGASPAEIDANEGVTTLTLSGSRKAALFFTLSWLGRVPRPACRGRIALVQRHIALRWNPDTPCTGRVAFSSRVDRHGDLVIVAVERSTRPRWLGRLYRGLWKRVDCTPSFEGPSATTATRAAGRSRSC